MARKTHVTRATDRFTATTHEGAAARPLDGKAKLVNLVLTSLMSEPKFYGDTTGELQKMAETIVATDPGFIARLAVYARRDMNLRSVSHYLTALLGTREGDKHLVGRVFPRIALRPDDVTETLAYAMEMRGSPTLTKQFRLAGAAALHNFNEYQFAKYRGEARNVSIRDAFRIFHPKPINEEQNQLWGRVVTNTLKTPDTWEVGSSAKGKLFWSDLEGVKAMGYMALLRNLRNISQHGSHETKLYAIETIVDVNRVRKSKQFPFRFYSAYKVLDEIGDPVLMAAVSQAMNASCTNVEIPGPVAVLCDVSGSMQDPISSKSTVKCCEVAGVMAGMAVRTGGVVIRFGSTADHKTIPTNANVLTVVDALSVTNHHLGWGTNMAAGLEVLNKLGRYFPTVIVVSDMQTAHMARGEWLKYQRQCAGQGYTPARLVCIDVCGYGNSQFLEHEVLQLNGWSERLFEYLKVSNTGEAMSKSIANLQFENYTIPSGVGVTDK